MRIPRNELALAYELHIEGCEWHYIALGLGRDRQSLIYAVTRLLLQP